MASEFLNIKKILIQMRPEGSLDDAVLTEEKRQWARVGSRFVLVVT